MTRARYDEALALLRALSDATGIRASLSDRANYRAIFTRDAVMAGIAGLLAGDATVVRGLVATLEALRALQGREGQVPSNYEPLADGGSRVSFGTLAPRLDSPSWYLLGVALAARGGAIDPGGWRDSARAAVRLLDAIEYNGRHLLYVPVGGNWADEYVCDGYILSDQLLRALALRAAGMALGEREWTAKAASIAEAVGARYWPEDDVEAPRRHPIASFTPAGVRDSFDLAAAALLALSGAAPRMASATLDWVDERFLARGALPPAFDPVIDETHPDWPALRRYHLHGFRNEPYEYHNGGIWPVWLGWLALALARAGREAELARLRAIAADRFARDDFRFDEYLHGVTGAPGGVQRMAYSATGVVFLALADSPRAAELLGA